MGSALWLQRWYPMQAGLCVPGWCQLVPGEDGVSAEVVEQQMCREKVGFWADSLCLISYPRNFQAAAVRSSWLQPGWSGRGGRGNVGQYCF